jgi:hypothetical protein
MANIMAGTKPGAATSQANDTIIIVPSRNLMTIIAHTFHANLNSAAPQHRITDRAHVIFLSGYEPMQAASTDKPS